MSKFDHLAGKEEKKSVLCLCCVGRRLRRAPGSWDCGLCQAGLKLMAPSGFTSSWLQREPPAFMECFPKGQNFLHHSETSHMTCIHHGKICIIIIIIRFSISPVYTNHQLLLNIPSAVVIFGRCYLWL